MNAKSPYKKNGVTVPRSPFTRDHERKHQVETIVPQPQLQPEDKDLLRQKQQEEHEKFLNVNFYQLKNVECFSWTSLPTSQ